MNKYVSPNLSAHKTQYSTQHVRICLLEELKKT